MLETPFPKDYYNKEAWKKNIIDFYGENKNLLPPEILEKPITMLTDAMYYITEIYGNFPKIVYDALKQTVDPLFDPEEYIEKVYKVLSDAAVEENRPLLGQYAESLLEVRKLFERNEEFYQEHFASVIERVDAENLPKKSERFGNVIQTIVQTHVSQVRRIIHDRKE